MFPRAVPVLAILAAAGCGGQDKSDDRSAATPAPKPASRLALVAPNTGAGHFRYSQKRLEAPAGRAELVLTNDDVHQHDFQIQTGTRCCYAAGAKDVGGTDIISGGTTTRALVDLKAGEYVYFCSVGSHAEDGMQGRLTVAAR
jgi:plastocyanin